MPPKSILTRNEICQRHALLWGTLPRTLFSGFMTALMWGTGIVSGQTAAESPAESRADQLFQFPPRTAEELVDAAHIAASLQRPTDARAFLGKLLELNLTPEQLVSLRSAKGPGSFLRLSEDSTLQPEAREVLLAVNAAARASVPSESRLQELVAQADKGDAAASQAIVQLVSAGNAAVPVLLSVPVDSPAGLMAERILSTRARTFRRGLSAALGAADNETRVRIINWLATTADPQLVFDLLSWRFAPDSSSEVESAAGAAIARLSGSHDAPESSAESLVMLKTEIRTRLNSAGQRFTLQDVPGLTARPLSDTDRAADVSRAVQLAMEAARISPEDSEVQALLTASQLAGSEPVLDGVPADVDAGMTPAFLWQVLGEATRAGNPDAAIGALRLLSQLASASRPLDGSPEFIRAASGFPDPRVRLLVAKLIQAGSLSEQPVGSVNRTLNAVRSGSLLPEAVVIDADSERMTTLSVALEDAGYAVRGGHTGAAGFEAAAGQLNCELILVHSNSVRWELSGTIANLRADCRTRLAPIVIYGPDYSERGGLSLARRYTGIWFIREPLGELTLADSLNLAGVPAPILSRAGRVAMKEFADR